MLNEYISSAKNLYCYNYWNYVVHKYTMLQLLTCMLNAECFLNKIFQYFWSFFFLENMPQICGISRTRNV